MRMFQLFAEELINQGRFEIDGLDETERIIQLRSFLIDFYAEKKKKKVVVGIFKQRPNKDYESIIAFSNELSIIFGVELIYCVKDISVITNIRQGGTNHEERIT